MSAARSLADGLPPDHETHRLLALALAQHFFHAGAEVRVVSVQVIVDEHVGIARDLQ